MSSQILTKTTTVVLTNTKAQQLPLTKRRRYIVVPYTEGLIESSKSVYGKHGILQVFLRGGRAIKNLLMPPKRFKCDMVVCDEEYIGESSRTLGESL